MSVEDIDLYGPRPIGINSLVQNLFECYSSIIKVVVRSEPVIAVTPPPSPVVSLPSSPGVSSPRRSGRRRTPNNRRFFDFGKSVGFI